jgi:hypothetical protein
MNALLEAALGYAAHGLPVFPCAPHAKHPACAHGLHDATTELDMIGRWWAEIPAANIGLPTGLGFDVLDLDNADAVAWAHEQGLPDGPQIATGHGVHVYVASTGSGNRVALELGVDYRGRGGYVIAPPSVHPSGARYELIAGDFDQIPDAPAWLRDRLAEQKTGTTGAARAAESLRSNLTPGQTPRPTVRGVASLRAMSEQLALCEPGRRNAYLFWAACTAADTGIGRADVELVLRDAAQRAGLGDTEITRTIRSAFGRWT